MFGEFIKLFTNDIHIQRFVGIRSEYRWKMMGLQFAQQHIAIGDSQRAAPPVTCRSGVRTGTLRPDLKATITVRQNRPATRGDGVNIHHRRTHPDTGDFSFKAPFKLTGVVANVSRGTPHVKTNQLVVAGQTCSFNHAHNTTGRAG